ncbi:CPBP family intramembrane metalloprotease [Arthrobacter sp. MSA 4-2]|uniref:CPBP family intramembrane glutamic endopeptidase n=1 Tax=Arthrobacter sp. MSA 4-2 TaxID=2794349 RepID=UPI0018E872C4|nr:type II CAAX endopeptidase family protein [Arthrobacter sp. MSA 4-2]MBJ2119360.1 CPBP family intramembrane metalloprotease [Arthrobacter sp. MSA 4-2]
MTEKIRRHPIAALLVWFFTVGQLLAFLPRIAESQGLELSVPLFVTASNLIGLLLPALVLTWLCNGRTGLRALRDRILTWRRNPWWYLFAVVVVPLGGLVLALLLADPPTASRPVMTAALLQGLVLQTALGLITSNLWEEVAWTGFVQVRLQQRHGALRAALMTAPLFALQHAALVAGGSFAATIILLLVLTLLAIPFRAVTGWLYNRTSSLLLVGLFHAAGNAVAVREWPGDGMLPLLYPGENFGPVHLLVSAVVGVIVIAATRGRLGEGPRRSGGAAATDAVAPGRAGGRD